MEAKQVYEEYQLAVNQSEQAGKDYLDTLTLSEYKALVEHLTILWAASFYKLEAGNEQAKLDRKMARI